MYKNVCDAAKAVLRGEFIAVSDYQETRKISNNLTLCTKDLEKQNPELDEKGVHVG